MERFSRNCIDADNYHTCDAEHHEKERIKEKTNLKI